MESTQHKKIKQAYGQTHPDNLSVTPHCLFPLFLCCTLHLWYTCNLNCQQSLWIQALMYRLAFKWDRKQIWNISFIKLSIASSLVVTDRASKDSNQHFYTNYIHMAFYRGLGLKSEKRLNLLFLKKPKTQSSNQDLYLLASHCSGDVRPPQKEIKL